MLKAKKYDWKDSNLALFGSDTEKKVKKESAQTEKAWEPVVTCNQPALFIWRIEKFKVVEWPKSDYGNFYEGDSYIVLNIYQPSGSEELLYDVHFWIGKTSTQDEYGTAAYKTVELDTLLDDKPVQHREVQGHESELFNSYFNKIIYWKGGVDSGFRHVVTKEYKPRLLHFSGDRMKIVVKEVRCTKNNLNTGDVFILDLGDYAYQWNGEQSSKDERFKAVQFIQQLNSDRNGKMKIEVLDESNTDPEFYGKLSDEPNSTNKKKENFKHDKKVLKLSDASGAMDFSDTDTIDEEDVFIIDNGDMLYVYIGQNASIDERRNGLTYAHNYLQKTAYPWLPVSVMSANAKGAEAEKFRKEAL